MKGAFGRRPVAAKRKLYLRRRDGSESVDDVWLEGELIGQVHLHSTRSTDAGRSSVTSHTEGSGVTPMQPVLSTAKESTLSCLRRRNGGGCANAGPAAGPFDSTASRR